MKKKLNLNYHFSDDELIELGKELSSIILKQSEVEVEKKLANSRFGREIAMYQKQIDDHCALIDNGFEERPIECDVVFNEPSPGQKRITRLDTNESWTEPMALDEHDLFSLAGVDSEEE